MKAVVQYKYGGADKLFLEEVSKPTIKDNQILIEVHAANIASGDMRINTIDVPMLLKPIFRLIFGFTGPRKKVRGLTGSGKIVEIGKKVTKYKKGDRVNYINSMNAGCLAEFLVLKEKSVMAKIADNVSYIDSAPIAFGAMSAFHFINEDTVKKGYKVLIYGASGSVGSYALQLAKYYGAEVTAVCSKKNHEVMKSIGADNVIDYKTEDFTNSSVRYDVVFDSVSKVSKKQCKAVLNDNGVFMSVRTLTKEMSSRVELLNGLLSENKISTLIDQVFKLEEYKEAHELVYGKHKVGNVVIELKK
jgi:NADPH:quinone reductase-like Zn-dependent oxidoreductase